MPLIQYPSVTVCVEYTFKKNINLAINENSTFDEAYNLLTSQNWKRNETFFFVNQIYEGNKGYPCMTTIGSQDFGRPCLFPFILKR